MSEYIYVLEPKIYGKLPLQGDFISQLPMDFSKTWDYWLQQGLGYTKDYFLKDWEEVFNKSPCWHFFLATGLCGDRPWIGIMLSSQDKVGRKFPITVVAELPIRANYKLFEEQEICQWLKDLETFTLQAINENNFATLERFQEALPKFKLIFKGEFANDFIQDTKIDNICCYCQSDDGFEKNDFYQHIATHYLVDDRPTGYCLWVSDILPVSYLFSIGLPKKEFFGAFLDKDCEGWGWKPIFPVKERTLKPLKRVKQIYKELGEKQPLSWCSSALTDVGNRRTINEDNFLVKDNIGLWSIADGMGGYDSGDFASEEVVTALAKLRKPYKMSEFVEVVEQTLVKTNDSLLKHFDDLDSRGGCTVVCLLIFSYHAIVMWVGDSRLYRHRDNTGLTMLTRDHSEAEEAVERGEMTAEEAEYHPSGNVITRAIGIEEELYIDMDMFSIQSGDIFLLCSDGLYKEMTDSQIEQQINADLPNIDKAAQSLMTVSLERKGRDNITLILVKIE